MGLVGLYDSDRIAIVYFLVVSPVPGVRLQLRKDPNNGSVFLLCLLCQGQLFPLHCPC